MTTSASNERDHRAYAGFTIIELLVVVMIITLLFSMLLSGIRTVQRHTLQAITQAEIKNIENAWKQYFTYYQMWPTNNAPYRIDEELAKAMQGDAHARQGVPPTDTVINPDGIVFMEFTRFDANKRPSNAWGESHRYDPNTCAYYVKFDFDGKNEIEVPLEVPKTDSDDSSTKTNLTRSVAVWTFNPEIQNAEKTGPQIMGSWMR